MAKRVRETIDLSYPSAKYQRVAYGTTGLEPETQKFKFDTAIEFLDQVKRQFNNQPDVYKEFLRIMKEFKSQEIDTPQVIEQVSSLFRGYDHLIEGFGHFLPQGHQMKPVPKSNSLNGSSHSTVSDKSKETGQETVETPSAESSSATPSKSDIENAQNFIIKVKCRFINHPEIYKEFIRTLKRFQRYEIPLKEVFCTLTKLFAEYTDLLLEFPKFLPDPHKLAQQRIQPVANVKDYSFFETAKIQLRNDQHLYIEFLKCLSLVNKRILAPAELLMLVEDLFFDYPDLFEQFRNMCELSILKDDSALMRPVKKADGIFCKLEIDYASCKRLGPSYRSLPREYVQPPSSGRNAFCNEILNDQWVSLPTGSEEGANFKSSHKNAFEELLFKCEDDRYELDMLIEQNYSTLQRLTEILQKLNNCSPTELTEFRVEELLDVLHLRSIEKLYGDKGAEILSNLFDNPSIAVPTVVKRLQQKDEEWRNSRSSWNQSWRVIHEKNYYKSLDHQGTSFKQRDKKELSLRKFLAEINKEKYQKTIQRRTAEHLSFGIEYPLVLRDIFILLQNQLKELSTFNDNEELELFLEDFFADFFMTNLDPTSPAHSNMTCGSFKFLFGDDEFYLFVRLIITLYTRISVIMNSSCSTLRRKIPAPVRLGLDIPAKDPAGARFESVQQLYRYYIDEMLNPLLRNELDQAKYEDECRQLFGVSAYLLFTIDRVLKTTVELVQSLCSEDDSLRLLALYYFESNRVFKGSDNLVYRTNACEIIDKDRLYRFTFTNKGAAGNRVLSISLLDHPKERPCLELSTAKREFKQYLKKFLGPGEESANSKTCVFLERNKKRSLRGNSWNKDLVVDNRLEAKICMTTFQMFYVQNTEDFFYRKNSLQRGRKNIKKTTQT